MVRYIGLMILAVAIMAVAYVGRDHRGTLVQDSLSYFSSTIAGAANQASPDPSANLPNPFDQGQVKQYVQEKFNQGVTQSQGSQDQVQQPIASDSQANAAEVDNSTMTAQEAIRSLKGTSDSLPDMQDQAAINSYIVQKFHEGETSGSKPALH